MTPGVVHVMLACTEAEALRVGNAMGLGHMVYPMTDMDLHRAWAIGYRERHLVRVDGWEQSRQPVRIVALAASHSDDEMTLPSYDVVRYGGERAVLAADALHRIREAKRHGSPFLDPASVTRQQASEVRWARDFGRWLAHGLGLCPRRQAGQACTAAPGTCRWPE